MGHSKWGMRTGTGGVGLLLAIGVWGVLQEPSATAKPRARAKTSEQKPQPPAQKSVEVVNPGAVLRKVNAPAVSASRGTYKGATLDRSVAGKTGGSNSFGPHRLQMVSTTKLAIYDSLGGKLSPKKPIVLPEGFSADDNLYAGLFRKVSEARRAWFSMDWDEFTSKWDSNGKDGFLLDDFERFTIGSKSVYAGLFKKGGGGNAAWITSDWKDFSAQWASFENQGLRMDDYESWFEGGNQVYAGIFHEAGGAHAAWIVSDWQNFTSKWDELGKQNLRMRDFEALPLPGGSVQYAGIFREGSDGNAAWVTADWNSFIGKWGEFTKAGLRITDFETYMDGKKRMWAGIFRAGGWEEAAWIGVDWENFSSMWHQQDAQNMSLVDVEAYPSTCPAECLNQVVMPGCEGSPETDCRYDYGITTTKTHCAGKPGTCPSTVISGSNVIYHQPVDTTASDRYARLSALDARDAIFTLPFSDSDLQHNGWLYSAGSWHHAIDYSRPGAGNFTVRAAAPGTVIHVGWDQWSGNTVVISHDAGGVKDAYRTIYMHLRNGPKHDCTEAWNTAAWLSTLDEPLANDHYEKYLKDSGCLKDGSGKLNVARWGSGSDLIAADLLGKTVNAGDVIAHAGSTGPGGCGCMPKDWSSPVGTGGKGPNTHLHIFFARRDPKDDQWYFFDPYGMYAPSGCYPSGMTDGLGACARYPIAWKGGKPEYP